MPGRIERTKEVGLARPVRARHGRVGDRPHTAAAEVPRIDPRPCVDRQHDASAASAVSGQDGEPALDGPDPTELLAAARDELVAGEAVEPRELLDDRGPHRGDHRLGVTVRAAERLLDGEDLAGDQIDAWKRRITLTGTLDPEQRTRLLEIADKCPVHRTLEGNSIVKTILMD